MAAAHRPTAGVDYPRDLAEFRAWFATEGACLEYLARVRWAEGFVCPRCGGRDKPWRTSRGLWHCGRCQAQTSVTAGTLFHRSRSPIRSWLDAMWLVTNQKQGVSALGLQRALGLGSYKTAWAWLHRLRRAMVRPGRDRLRGTVEVDETYVGGPEEGVSGRGTEGKALVAVAAEVRGRRIGRIRLQRIPDASAQSLHGFVQQAVEPRSLLVTDDWKSYEGVESLGYRRKIKNIAASGRRAHKLLPRVHKVASLLKRWLMGTHHGGVQQRHLEYYLDEFTFRFNRRSSSSRGLLFYRLVQQAVALEPTPYHKLVAPKRHRGRPQRVGGT